MESSDKFDDFMKALGVGMIKRKLANSVVPINEVSSQTLKLSYHSLRWRSARTA